MTPRLALSALLMSACGTDANMASVSSDAVSSASSAQLSNATSRPTDDGSLGTASSAASSSASSSSKDVVPSDTSDGDGATTTSASSNANSSGDSTSSTSSASDESGSRDNSDTREQSDSSAVDAGPDNNETSTSGASSDSASGSSSSDGSDNNDCEFSGTVSYRINEPESFPEDALEKLSEALEEAIYYYNCYSDLSHSLTINYKPSVPTAEGNVDGVISFGSDRNYMVVATVMHEIGHTMGVGYAPWSELIQDGQWVGPAVVEFMTNLPANERDPDSYSQRTYITCDAQHFWPYGLNQAAEHQSEWSLINHVRIVAAMNKDKDAYR